jgi:hypothetical protein
MQFLPNTKDYNLISLIGTPSGDFGYKLCPVTTYGITYPDYPSPNPTLYGYHFIGWNTEPDGTGFGVDPYIRAGDLIRFSLFSPPTQPIMVNGKAVSGILQLYALWELDISAEPYTVTVTFDAMGGTHINTSPLGPPYYAPSDLTHEHHLLDLTAVNGFLPFVPTPEWLNDTFLDGEHYYVFEGWSFSNAPNRTVAEPEIVNWRSDLRFLNNDITVYAVWKKNYVQNVIINSHLIQRIRKIGMMPYVD